MLYTKSHISVEDYVNRIVKKFRLIIAQRNDWDSSKFWRCLRCGRVNEKFYFRCQECGHLKSRRYQGR